jgi:hypothetical protein
MKYYNIESYNKIIKLNNKCSTLFPQKTNVFSYYILKNILLSNFNQLTDILDLYTIHYKINNDIAIDKIINLIMNNISKQQLLAIKDDKNKSLRMTLYEIKI